MNRHEPAEQPLGTRYAIRGRNSELPKHILSSSGTMIGLCTTMIGLLKIVEGRLGPTNVDVYLALLGSVFLGSAILSYVSMRIERRDIGLSFERMADVLFLGGLILIVCVVLMFALEAI